MAAGHVVHVVTSLARLQQVIGHHRVEGESSQLDADPPQHDRVVLQVLADLFDCRIFENRLQRVANEHGIELGLTRWRSHRNVARFAHCPGERVTHNLGPTRMERGRLRIETNAPLLLESEHELLQLGRRCNRAVIRLPLGRGSRRQVGRRWCCIFRRLLLGSLRPFVSRRLSRSARRRSAELDRQGLDPPSKLPKAALAAHICRCDGIDMADSGRVPVDNDRHVRFQTSQFAAFEGDLPAIEQIFLALRAGDFVSVGEHLFERTVFG